MNRFFGVWLAALVLLASAAVAQSDNETCLSCHSDNSLTGMNKHGAEVSMFVTQQRLDSSVHVGMACVNCHTDLASVKDFPHAESLQPVQCGNCHTDVADVFKTSAHGMASNNPNAATCVSCHGSHKILPQANPESMISVSNLPSTCSSCHSKMVLKTDPDLRLADSYDRYMRGIHAEGIAKGVASAATCNDCHGMHDLKKASDPASSVNKMNIPKTCAKCHNDIYIKYARGIHGKALEAGILDAPNCTDCHGEHEILEVSNPSSPVNSANIADYVCSKCHNDPRVVEKYGLHKEKFSSYQDSYHGLAVRGGSVKAASCASCHQAHDILPRANVASSINDKNIVKTCQKCHPQANQAFATSYSHNTAEMEFSTLDSTVKNIYIIAIVLVIGGMLAHNLIIVFRYVVQKHRQNKQMPTVERFTPGMVFQHLVLTFAFITLVVTGFALRYPNEWWVKVFNSFGIHEDVRSVIHRIAAVLLCYISIHHAGFLMFSRRGRIELKALWPTKQDIVDVWLNMKFYLGLSKEHPKFDRFDYTEKAEYWALVWGTVIMALTGFILWFPTFFTGFMPAWTVRIAETVHLYEAWLATLAIAVFHFFFVIFHPDQYPMSLTWITGQMTIDSCKEHHPAWYERITKENAAKTDGASEPPKGKEVHH